MNMSRTTPLTSSSSVPYGGGPLTTIFTPPPGCFDTTPSLWTSCTSTSTFFSCFWSLPDSCYPVGASTQKFDSTPFAYHYYPGVLPSGFTSFLNPVSNVAGGLVQGCLDGWGVGDTSYYYCTMTVYGSFEYSTSDRTITTSTGFIARMPHVEVTWGREDLSLFTPASAPVLPYSVLTKFEASVAAAQQTSPKRTSAATPKASEMHVQESANGLSTGAQAGIGVGVGIVALLLLFVLAVVVLRRRRRRPDAVQGMDSSKAYLDSKAELPENDVLRRAENGTSELPIREAQEMRAVEMPRSELPAREPQEMNSDGRHELHGGFEGHEAGGNRPD